MALFIFALTAVAAVHAGYVSPARARMQQETLSIVTKAGGEGHRFDIEIAESEQEKALGLMFRTELGDQKGMLFPYQVSRPVSMWMRNTYISLDMLFIRSDGAISRIEENAEPQSERIIESGGPVAAVLEIAGGASKRLGISVGDKVRYKLFDGASSW